MSLPVIRWSRGLAWLAVTVACTSERRAVGVARRESTAPAVATPAVAGPANGGLGTTADLLGGEADCPADTLAVHPDPVALIQEYIRRDLAGTLASEDWQAGAVTCVELTTSDYLAVVTSYEAVPIATGPDTARLLVRFQPRFSLGYDATGSQPLLVPDTVPVTDTAVVVRTRKGWRLDRYPGGVHVAPSTALRRLVKLSREDQAKLRQLGARSGA